MITAFIIVIVIGFIALAFSCYFLHRNEKVKNFRIKILDASEDYWNNRDDFKFHTQYQEMKNYQEMLFSFKKLTPENWLSKKSFEELKKYLSK